MEKSKRNLDLKEPEDLWSPRENGEIGKNAKVQRLKEGTVVGRFHEEAIFWSTGILCRGVRHRCTVAEVPLKTRVGGIGGKGV